MKIRVTDLVAIHPACSHYNKLRLPQARLTEAVRRHSNLLRSIIERFERVHGLLCCEEKVIDAELSNWARIIGKVDAICLKVNDRLLDQLIAVEVKGYKACGLCEKLQLALYVITLALKLGTTKVSGVLICNNKVEIITLDQILKPGLYEELSKIISIIVL